MDMDLWCEFTPLEGVVSPMQSISLQFFGRLLVECIIDYKVFDSVNNESP